jgi:hypothetical protein
MESVDVCFRSARDDLPIFTLTMSSADASFVTKTNDGMIMRATLGNFTVTTPQMGRTHEQYHTLLGLAPGKSNGLLSICYIQGKTAMSAVNDDNLLKNVRTDTSNDLGAWALVTISPMRMVYIQAQVLALVEYATEGILGALTSQAASSAAVAASEMASSGSERKVFVVRTTGFEVLLPERATNELHFSVKTGALSAEYTALPEPGGGVARVSLSGVMIADSLGAEMQDQPIHMGVDKKAAKLFLCRHRTLVASSIWIMNSKGAAVV